jgi:HTH-like domain/Integrase core domain
MRLLDEPYTRTPFDGSRRMTAWLRGAGDAVNRKRVVRLMGEMGLEAISPRPRLSAPGPAAKVYPDGLQGVEMNGPHQVWSPDLTYMPRQQGFMDLVAIMDWYSRFGLAWELSHTLDVGCCLVALEGAWAVGKPHLFNSDQGDQYPAETPDRRGQRSRDGLEPPLPSAPSRKAPIHRQQAAQGLHLRRGLRQHAQQRVHGMQMPKDHHHQRLQQQAIQVRSRATASTLCRGRRDRYLTDQLYQRDKQGLVFYHGGYLRVLDGVVTTMMRRWPRDGQALARPFDL